MAFLHKDISSIPLGKADTDAVLKQKLENFRKKVETGKLVKYWDNADELNALVAISLPKTIKMFPKEQDGFEQICRLMRNPYKR